MSLALFSQHANSMSHIILSSVTSLAVPYFFPRRLINDTTFGQKLLNTICVFWFSLQHLSETFLLLRRIQLNIITNVHMFSCKTSVVLADFNETWILSTDFLKIHKYLRLWQSVLRETSCSMWTERQRDWHDEANNLFFYFCERAWNPAFCSHGLCTCFWFSK
jgi:hypothetical protein